MEHKFKFTKTNSKESIDNTIKAVGMQKVSFIIYFASASFDFKQITDSVKSIYPDVQTIGCVSTGEIGPNNEYTEGTFSILSVYSEDFKAEAVILTNLNKKVMLYKRRITRALNNIGVSINKGKQKDNYFIVSLIDAFSQCEERMGILLRNIFNDSDINFVGGSAGNLNGYSFVAVNGRVELNAAALLCVKTKKKIKLYCENIYSPKGKEHRVTKADIKTRTVIEADGIPFIDLYSKEVGVPKNKIDQSVFSKNPIGRSAGDNIFISSPLKVNSDGSITFYSRVLSGRQFYFMKADSLLDKARETGINIIQDFKKPELILGFNCILRYIEMQAEGLCESTYRELSKIVNAPYYGFTTLGEQINMIHANQTLTLLVLGD